MGVVHFLEAVSGKVVHVSDIKSDTLCRYEWHPPLLPVAVSRRPLCRYCREHVLRRLNGNCVSEDKRIWTEALIEGLEHRGKYGWDAANPEVCDLLYQEVEGW